MRLEPQDVRFFAAPDELRDWFDLHAAEGGDLWVGYQKQRSGRTGITHAQAVDEALCVGWIDSAMSPLDDLTYTVRFTPRRAGSLWSAANTRRGLALTEEGRMRPAGMAAFEARSPVRTASSSYEQAAAALTEEELARFRATPGALARFEVRPASYRKMALYWVLSAKRPETRARRLQTLVADSAAGRKIVPLAREPRR